MANEEGLSPSGEGRGRDQQGQGRPPRESENAGVPPGQESSASAPPPDNEAAGALLEEPQEAAADDPLAGLTAERDALMDSLLRLRADFENFRKRSRREMEEAEGRARGRLLVEFLPVLDNLGRALDAAEHHEEGKVLDGVRMTHNQFVSLLEKEGVKEISPLGEPFNPELHEAMLSQPSSAPEGTITGVLDRGYVMGDRVLRPARVAVSAGPAGDGPSGPRDRTSESQAPEEA